MEWRVILDKGIDHRTRVWVEKTRSNALIRVYALCELHSCDYTEYDPGAVMVVHADTYYKTRS